MKKIIKITFLFLFVILSCGCGKVNVSVDSKSLFYMDTYIQVKLYDCANSEEIFNKIDNIYKEYHELTDRYNSYDGIINVYYLNNVLKNKESIEIDDRLADLIQYGIDAYSKTDGYINIAIGNLVDIWKHYRDDGTKVPTKDELESANIDIKNISVKNKVYSKKKDVKIDLGAYAKGYVTEIVGEYLEEQGINKYLINAGGNVKVGSKYNDNLYKVGLEEPFNTSNVYEIINVENKSIVTSGSYQRYYEVDNVIYNHIINPKTLYPDNYTKSVTIICDNSKEADILSTYMFMLPIDRGLEIINNLDGVEAIWYADTIYKSSNFNKYE